MTWSLLDSLDETERRKVLSLARRRRFARGEVVFHESDPGNSMHLVDKGHFAVRITTPLGDVATLRIHGPGSYFGEMAVLSPAPRSASVVALGKAETLSLSESVVTDLRSQSAAVDRLLMEAMITEVRRLSGALVEALYLPAQKRVLRRLADLAETFGADAPGVSIPVTQEELAQLAGTTRPTANRILRSLEDDGILTIERGRIEITNLDALARLAS